MGKFINGKKLCTVLFDVGREGRCFLVDIRNGEGGRRQSSLKKFDISAIGLYDMTSLFPLPVGTGCLYTPVNRYIYIYISSVWSSLSRIALGLLCGVRTVSYCRISPDLLIALRTVFIRRFKPNTMQPFVSILFFQVEFLIDHLVNLPWHPHTSSTIYILMDHFALRTWAFFVFCFCS